MCVINDEEYNGSQCRHILRILLNTVQPIRMVLIQRNAQHFEQVSFNSGLQVNLQRKSVPNIHVREIFSSQSRLTQTY